jgi:6-phosphogluconate dehydrogenase
MVSAGTTVDVLQQLSPLLGGDAVLQDLGVALFIDLSFDDDV